MTSGVVDLGELTRPKQIQVPMVVLLADVPVQGEQANSVTAKMLVDALLAGVRQIVREELNAAVSETE